MTRPLLPYQPQQPEVQTFGAKHGILTRAWSPIGGITFYRDDAPHPSTFDDRTIGRIAEALARSHAQVKLGWHLQEGRSVIPKSTKPHRIAANIDVSDFERVRPHRWVSPMTNWPNNST
jgi:diketogulonate reductase-like aldo/keto reductase